MNGTSSITNEIMFDASAKTEYKMQG